MVRGFYEKNSIIDIWLGSKYHSEHTKKSGISSFFPTLKSI